MNKKVVDILAYKIEKTLKNNGFIIKKDNKQKVKLILKINKKNHR